MQTIYENDGLIEAEEQMLRERCFAKTALVSDRANHQMGCAVNCRTCDLSQASAAE